MNYSTYNISLDIHDTASQVSLNVKKGDTARRICAVFTENGKPYKIADGCAAVFRAKKPARDNGERAIVYNDAQIIDNKICYVVTSENTETAGVADCELTLYGADGKAITSPKFTLVIDNTVNSDDEVENIGTNELTALTIAFANATAATSRANEAAGDAQKAATDATNVANEIKRTADSGGFDGKQGAVFTPYVDNNGNLSWSNDGNLENPLTKNIMGPQGQRGLQGEQGERGKPGERGVSGVYVGGGEMPEGYNVQVDPDGEATLVEVGETTTLSAGSNASVTSTLKNGKVSLNFGIPRGEKGEQGERGEPGKDAAVKEWNPIADFALTESQPYVGVTPAERYTEVYIECAFKVETAEATSKSVQFGIGRGSNYIVRNTVSVKNGDIVRLRAFGVISPSKQMVYYSTASVSRFADVASNCNDPTTYEYESFGGNEIRFTINNTAYQFGVGSTIKIWGR